MEVKKLLEVLEANPQADILFYFEDEQIFINPNSAASYARQSGQSRKVITRDIVQKMAEKKADNNDKDKAPKTPENKPENKGGDKTPKAPEGNQGTPENKEGINPDPKSTQVDKNTGEGLTGDEKAQTTTSESQADVKNTADAPSVTPKPKNNKSNPQNKNNKGGNK